MRVRKLDANGDYLIGSGEADFWINKAEGVGQNVTTRLLLWEGSWFLDKTQGTPWSTEVLGYGTASLRDIVIRQRILETDGVTSIFDYTSAVSTSTRKLTVSGSVITRYSSQPVSFGPVTL